MIKDLLFRADVRTKTQVKRVTNQSLDEPTSEFINALTEYPLSGVIRNSKKHVRDDGQTELP